MKQTNNLDSKVIFGQGILVLNLNGKGNSRLWYFIFKTSFDFQLRAVLHILDFSISQSSRLKFLRKMFNVKIPFAVFTGHLKICVVHTLAVDTLLLTPDIWWIVYI